MISIAIPLYNKAQSIENTIRCIQAQTYQDFEIVVVDGYSKDGSLEIIRRLAEEDPRIHLFMQEDKHGVTPARNESILHSQYEHIAFIDADDYWEPTYLATLVKLMEDYPECGLWGLGHGVMRRESRGERGEARGESRETRDERRELMVDGLSTIGSQEVKVREEDLYPGFRGIIANPWVKGSPFWTSAIGISKKAFEAVGGFDNRIIYGEDLDMWYRLMLEFPCAYDDVVLSYYRTDAENRACNHVFPLKIHYPYYIGKYAKWRESNVDFRRYFDLQCLYRLYPYAVAGEYRKEMWECLNQIDWSLQKKSLYWRFRFPKLYNIYRIWKGRGERNLEEYQGGSMLS